MQNVSFGATVRIIIGGEESGSATAPLPAQSSGGVVLFGGAALPAGAATTTLNIGVTVPDLEPGSYLATAVGPDFTIPCGPGENGAFEVLASDETARPGDGSLPRTGIYIALLLALAVVLLLVGRALLSAARRRRNADERARARHLITERASLGTHAE